MPEGKKPRAAAQKANKKLKEQAGAGADDSQPAVPAKRGRVARRGNAQQQAVKAELKTEPDPGPAAVGRMIVAALASDQ